MAEALILDAGAVGALVSGAPRVRAILAMAYEERALVRVPAGVLAEVWRGAVSEAAVVRVLNGRGIEVVDVTGAIARVAG